VLDGSLALRACPLVPSLVAFAAVVDHAGRTCAVAREESLRGRAAIVGVADAVSPTGELEGTTRTLEVRMISEALDDAGLTIADVDAVFSNSSAGWAPSLDLAEYLGISPRWTDSTNTGGSSFEIHVEHAAAAIALGRCGGHRLRRHTAIIVQTGHGRLGQSSGGGRRDPDG